MPDADTPRDKLIREFLASSRIFSKDFVKALDAKNRAKTLEAMTEHLMVMVQSYLNAYNKPGDPNHVDEKKLEKMKEQLLRFFGDVAV